MTTKLNVLLAKTDHLAASFKKGLEDYIKFFKNHGGSFKGELKTYEPKQGMIDDPSQRANKLVVTTVEEKLQWLEESSAEYIDALFCQERTNASGVQADLIVEGKVWGKYTSLELLKLKSLLEAGNLVGVYENLPVRNDDEIWTKTSTEMYTDRDVYESTKHSGIRKSLTKESYILPDPNIQYIKDGKYTPQVASKDTVIDVADYTFQRFSGEYSHRQRAEILRRRTTLVTAVIEALKVANEAEAMQSSMTAARIFGYLHKGDN